MAVGTYALTSNAKLQSFVGSVYVAAEETLWNMLIDIATGIIERNTHRLLKSREYAREVYNGTGGSRLYLKQWPVSQVRRVSIGRTSAFSIKNTTAKTRAEVEVTATSILLRADGATSPTEIKFTDYATITLLVAKIETYAGWDCGLLVSDYGALASTECLRRPAMACKDPDLAYVEMPDEDMTDYYLENPDEDRNAGMLFSPSGFESGVQNIFVDYTAGFATIPNDLEGACLILAKLLYDQAKKDLAVQSETLGDYSYSLAAAGAEASIGVPAIIAPVIGYYKGLWVP
jgi:hypothetical protein